MPLLDGLVECWEMDTVPGLLIGSHAARNLTNNNAVTTAAGKLSEAGLFASASNQHLSIAGNAAPIQRGDFNFALGCWFWPDGDVTNTWGLGGQWQMVGNLSWLLQVDDSAVQFFIDSVGDASGISFVQTGEITAETWHHVLAQHNKDLDQITIWLDGVLQNTTSHSGGAFAATGDLCIGLRESDGFYWNGMIDQFFLRNQFFTGDEVAELYAGGAGNSFVNWTASAGGRHHPLRSRIFNSKRLRSMVA